MARSPHDVIEWVVGPSGIREAPGACVVVRAVPSFNFEPDSVGGGGPVQSSILKNWPQFVLNCLLGFRVGFQAGPSAPIVWTPLLDFARAPLEKGACAWPIAM